MKRYIVLIYIGLLSNISVCQEYAWQADIDSISASGFHSILLETEVTAQLRPGYPDLRILDENGVQSAYILRHEERSEKWTNFVEYDIISKEYDHYDWYWDRDDRYIIKVGKNKTIDHIVLKIANFEDTRSVYISGSYDGKQWYVIKDHFTLHNIVSEDEDHQYKVLHFPKSTYPYYKLMVGDGWHDDPINVLAAGYFIDEVAFGKYRKVEMPPFTQTDSMAIKQTIVNVPWNDGNYIDKIAFDIGGADMYHRHVEVLNKVPETDTSFTYQKVRDLWVSSTHLNEIHFNKLHSYGLKVIIHNNDDKPLFINDIKYLQLNTYLISDLDPATDYYLAYGHDSIPAPVYDLTYFRSDIPEDLPTAVIDDLRMIPIRVIDIQEESSPETETAPAFYEKKMFIWIVIGCCAFLLGYMSTRMLAEMRDKD